MILWPLGKASTKFITTRNEFENRANTGIVSTRIIFDTIKQQDCIRPFSAHWIRLSRLGQVIYDMIFLLYSFQSHFEGIELIPVLCKCRSLNQYSRIYSLGVQFLSKSIPLCSKIVSNLFLVATVVASHWCYLKL